MRGFGVLVIAALGCCLHAAGYAQSLTDAFNQGAALGRSGNAAARGQITGSTAQSNVPGYTASPPQASYFGSAGISAPAAATANGCASGSGAAAGFSAQACNAIHFSQTNASRRASVTIAPDDPLLAGGKTITANPQAIADNLSGTYRDCSVETPTRPDCASQQFCLDGLCFDTAHAPDPDFARAVTGLEVQREAGSYLDPDHLDVFQGYDNRCRRKLFGLINCCKGGGTGGSLFSDMRLIAGAGGELMGAVGSSYTYDALFASDAPDLVISGFEALFGAGGGSSALAGLMAGDLSVSAFVETLVPGPWTMAMLAIELSGLLSCDQAEQVLAMKNDNRLCHGVGSYCSKRIPIIGQCVETTETYCCFNSRLARILNEQGRAQLGRAWGGAQSPDCSGFTIAQLQALDFSRLDLSEFYAEIAPTMPEVGTLQQQAQQRVNRYFAP